MQLEKIRLEGFEEIWKCTDEKAGLISYIAVHSTRLGPSLGGIRMYPYADEAAALEDVLRLAKAMSYKAAGAGVNLGGGKAVILGDPSKDKTPSLLKAMGQFVHKLNGRYLAAKDAGIVTEDLVTISKETPHVTGLPHGSGDPSPWTGLGIFEGLKACLSYRYQKADFDKIKVGIQGMGHVGSDLAARLLDAGSSLIVADTDKSRLTPFAENSRVETTAANDWIRSAAQVLSPCAMGGILNPKSIRDLNCEIIAGGANNQLLDEERDGQALLDRNILFAPDYILNAGGIINIYVRDILKKPDCTPWIEKIGPKLLEIFQAADKKGVSPMKTANSMMEDVLLRS